MLDFQFMHCLQQYFFQGKKLSWYFHYTYLGIGLAFLIGLLFKNTYFKKDEEPFIIELPEYKLPNQ